MRVVAHLISQGFEIVARNARVGRLEIDIIARRGTLLVFCEVRGRSASTFMAPIESIDAAKRARMRRAAAAWLSTQGLRSSEVRIDAAQVVFDTPEGRLDYYEDCC